MKWFLSITIVFLAVFAGGDVIAQGNLTPPCRARTLDLRAIYGDNDIEGSTDVTSTLSGTPLVDVSNNYWGDGSFIGTNVTYSGGTGLGSSVISRNNECSGGLEIAKGKGQVPQSVQDTALSHCDSLFNIGYADFESYLWKQSYDTLRLFMEQCPFYYNSPAEFGYIYDDVDGWQAGGAGRWPDFLAWLKKVLYYNPDTTWYCQDALDMVYALQNDDAASMAVLNYVITSGKCPNFESEYNNAMKAWHFQWLDSIQNSYYYLLIPPTVLGQKAYEDSIKADTLAHPFDTTLPSLYAVDLQILMGPQYTGVQQSQPITSQALLDAQLLENPIKDEIDIGFEMGRTALVTMQLSDVLGRTVPLTYAKYQLEQPGQHDAVIPAPNLPPGTYYLRISTDVGDAKTLKVVKE